MSPIPCILLLFLVFIACSSTTPKSSMEAEKILERAVSYKKASKQEGNSYKERADKPNEGLEATGHEVSERDNSNGEDELGNSLQDVRNRLFQQYCVQAVPKTGDSKVIRGRTLNFITSMFPVCIAYECLWVLKLPSKVCHTIAEQAKILSNEAKKYKRRLYIKGLQKRAVNELYIVG